MLDFTLLTDTSHPSSLTSLFHTCITILLMSFHLLLAPYSHSFARQKWNVLFLFLPREVLRGEPADASLLAQISGEFRVNLNRLVHLERKERFEPLIQVDLAQFFLSCFSDDSLYSSFALPPRMSTSSDRLFASS